MAGGNVAHCGEQFGDEDDMLFITMNTGITDTLCWSTAPPSTGRNIMC